jgi:hypothetical protein
MTQQVVVVKVKYNCGCRYETDKGAEAIAHSQATGHAIHVLGLIGPDSKVK